MESSTRKVLVTGATGFLGSQILSALEGVQGVEVIVACRSPERLPRGFRGEHRVGDLTNPEYRKRVVKGVDVLCHAGTWGAFWGHHQQERALFLEPTLDLIEQLERAGGRRFLLASTVALSKPSQSSTVDDFSPGERTGYWPHLDRLIDVDEHMRKRASTRLTMVNMRLGHFVGAGNRLGLVPALVPRLKTRLVPWLAQGNSRLPLVSGSDLGQAFARAALVDELGAYESFNICGPSVPTAREVFEFICERAGVPLPWFSVPYTAGFAFGWLMEALHPILPGSAPFLTRSLVHVAQDWNCNSDYAKQKLGYVPQVDWRDAINASLDELRQQGYPWPRLAQTVSGS